MNKEDALTVLQKRVDEMLEQSGDENFTRFLTDFKQKIREEKGRVNSLYAEFNSQYAGYLKRIQVSAEERKETGMKAEAAPLPEAVPVKAAVKRKSGAEFKIGAWVFSIVGALFVLAAFAILGTNFMTGMVKGISLYLVSIVLLVISETVLTKKMPKFSLVITGLGICSLYASTIINYIQLKNFNEIVTLIITSVITGLAVFISRRKNSVPIKIISFIGCYICLFPVNGFVSDVNFLVLTGILFAINLLMAFLPVKRAEYGINIMHMICNTVFTGILLAMGMKWNISPVYLLLYIASSVWILDTVYIVQNRMIAGMEKEDRKFSYSVGNICTYCITLFAEFLYLLFLSGSEITERLFVHITVAVIVAMAVIVFAVLRKSSEKWIQYFAANVLILLIYLAGGKSSLEITVSVLGLFIVSCLLGRIPMLKVSELVLTVITAATGLYFYTEKGAEGFFFAAAFLLSVLTLYHWKSFYEGMITAMLCAFAFFYIPETAITVPVCVGIILMGMLGFSSVGFFRGRCNKVYNICGLIAMTGIYLYSALIENPITYVCLCVFGVTAIAVVLQPKYGLEVKGKPLIFSAFLTYMALILKTDLPIAVSIALMVVAIGSVISGFILSNTGQRVYGLVLSGLVCLKVVLYDFRELEPFYRMILLFAVGLIALAISGVYIVLEKRVKE